MIAKIYDALKKQYKGGKITGIKIHKRSNGEKTFSAVINGEKVFLSFLIQPARSEIYNILNGDEIKKNNEKFVRLANKTKKYLGDNNE